MFSVFLLLIAAAGSVIGLLGVLAWRRSRSTLLLFCLAALAAVVVETVLAGVGGWIGVGDQLLGLWALPGLLATLAWPMTLFTLATLSRRLEFAWARIDWGHGAVCLLAVALLVSGMPELLRLRALQPACWQDVVWYLSSVPVELACRGESAWPAPLQPWVMLVVVLAAWLALGVGLWRRQHRADLFAAMAAGSALLLLPTAWGPLPRYLGLMLCFGAITREVVHHVAHLAPPPRPRPDADAPGT